jgi:hypothetical protein
MPPQVDESGEKSEEITPPSEIVRTKHGDLSLHSNPLVRKSMMNEFFDKEGNPINASGKRVSPMTAEQMAKFKEEDAAQTAQGKAAKEKFLQE